MSLQIRPTTPADLPAITAIYEHAVRTGTATFELEPPDLAEMTQRYEALVAGGFPYLVATLDGAVVGYAYAGPYRARPAYRFTVENSVYLDPKAQGKRIGTQLLQALIAESEKRGYRLMVAVIGDSANLASIGVHTRTGFRDGRHAPERRPEVRPLARHRADAAPARRGREYAFHRARFSASFRGAPNGVSRDARTLWRVPGMTLEVRCRPHTSAGLRSITSSTRSSSWPRRRMWPLADTTL